jgi:hypothetical protein
MSMCALSEIAFPRSQKSDARKGHVT